jgi:hypothetical protein
MGDGRASAGVISAHVGPAMVVAMVCVDRLAVGEMPALDAPRQARARGNHGAVERVDDSPHAFSP